MKQDSREIGELWEIGKRLWRRDFSAVYELAKNPEWPPYLESIVSGLVGALMSILCTSAIPYILLECLVCEKPLISKLDPLRSNYCVLARIVCHTSTNIGFYGFSFAKLSTLPKFAYVFDARKTF